MLTELSDIWKDVVESLTKCINEPMMTILQKMQVEYNSEEVKTFYLFLKSADGKPVVVNTCDLTLTMVKIQQTIEDSCQRYMIVNTESFNEQRAQVLALWKTVWCDVLIIASTACHELVAVIDACGEISNKLLVLVNSGFHFSADNVKIAQDSFSFTQLHTDSQNKLKNKLISFEGNEILLGVVIGCNADVITADVLHDIICGKYDVEIGRQLLIPYYISRSVERYDYLREGTLNKFNKEYFVISHVTAEDMQSVLPRGEEAIIYKSDLSGFEGHHFIIADDISEQNFRSLSTRLTNNTLHWLEFEEGGLRWRQTHGDIGFIQQNLSSDRRSVYADCRFTPNDRVVLVTAEPGMGKSTLVRHLEQDIRRSDPSLWVSRINLNDTSKLLEIKNDFSNIDDVIDFLVSAYSLHETPTEQKIPATELQRKLKISFEGIVLFFDGFDEICPVYFDKVISLLQCVLRTKVQKVWITARRAVRPRLEKALSVISYTLKPFTTHEQHDFLTRYWSLTTPDAELKHKLAEFADKLLKLTSESIHDREQEFTGIPLQTYMLAESFNEKMKDFVCEGGYNLPTRLNLLALYEIFIERKEQLYHKEKMKADTTNAALLAERESQRKRFLKKHKKAALLALLSNKEMKTLKFAFKDEKKFYEDFEKAYEKRGIIDGVLNGKPRFIHRTFAEYFLALWLTEHLKDIHNFIQDNFFTENYETIRYFFDSILSKGFEFHTAVLGSNMDRIQCLMKEEEFDINKVDSGRRTALHLAASYSDTDGGQEQSRARIKLLLDHNVDVSIEDSILGWRPLRYADAMSLWGNIDVLLRGNYDVNDLVRTTQYICNGNVLCEATRRGCVNLLRFVFDSNVDVNIIVKPQQRWTLLHVAANADNSESLNFLLEKGADVHALDVNYKNALHVATSKGHLGAIKLLVENGADVVAWDRDHVTPLHVATERGYTEVVRYLVACAGANVMSRNDDLVTPLMLATMKKFDDIAEILRARGAHT